MEGFNGFPFSNNSSSSSSSGSSSTNQLNNEATMKKIIEAIELLETLAKIGQFPQEKLDEIKHELKKKYPNIIFSSENDSQKPNNNNHHHHPQNSSTFPNSNFPNNSAFPSDYFTNLLNQQQQLHQQTQLYYTQMLEQNMRMMGVPWRNTFTPNYHNVTYPSYPATTNYGQMSGDPMKLVLEMMANNNNPDPMGAAAFGAFGSDGSSALSFLGSLLGGGFGM